MKARKTYLEPEYQRRTERLLLFLYLFHVLTLSITVLVLGWSFRTLIPLLVGAPVILYMYIKKYRTYTFRACFTCTLLWISLTIYGVGVEDFVSILVSISAVIIVMALYGLPEVIAIGNGFFTVMVLYHLFVRGDITLSAETGGMRGIMRIFFVYFIEVVVYYLVRLQRDSNQRLYRNIESLRRAERSKDDFLANVSHEIRTPVNTICGMSEIVLQNDLPEQTRGYMYGIQTAGRNLLSLVSDILDFSELESGGISIRQEPYSITSVMNDIINTTNAKNSEKDLELIVDCDPRMPSTLIGDRQRICRAVINVLDNAIKFTEDGGVVLSITTRPEEYGTNLCISVRDTGIGIRPDMLEKLFTSFNQADTRRSRAEGGIGLGLAISKAIVNKMGGFLKVQSVYGEGTSVDIIIPQKVDNAAPCIAVREPENIRILVYLHLDKYKYPLLRDSSRDTIKNMALHFDVSAYACRSLSELKRRAETGTFTHLFIRWEEYCEDRAYFEALAQEMQVTLIIDRKFQQELPDSHILCISAPLYALSVASILNGETVRDVATCAHPTHFIAPDVHVLVVDDNLMNLKVVEGLLRPYQLKLSTAQSGKEALKMLEDRSFDFVFMDHMMPEMDGVETFRRIREKKDPYYQNLPVIALTANAVGHAREMFLAEGFADYISKPIEMSALEHVLHKFIPREKMIYAGREIELSRPARPEPSKKADAAPLSGLAQEGIDTALGIGYCGGALEDYLEIVRIYCKSGEKNLQGIRDACAGNDWKQYVLLTHTLKSTSKSIGATKLSQLAAELEAAGREEDLARIEESTEPMLAEYGRVLRVLAGSKEVFPASAADEDNEPSVQKPAEPAAADALTPEEFADLCRQLSDAVAAFDGDAVSALAEQLRGRTYRGGDAAALLRPVFDRADDFDFLGAEEALSQIMEGERLK